MDTKKDTEKKQLVKHVSIDLYAEDTGNIASFGGGKEIKDDKWVAMESADIDEIIISFAAYVTKDSLKRKQEEFAKKLEG